MPPILYVGVDVHQATHHAALLSARDLDGAAGRRPPSAWTCAMTRTPTRTSSRAIVVREADPARVAVAVDFTGGHYSAPSSNCSAPRTSPPSPPAPRHERPPAEDHR